MTEIPFNRKMEIPATRRKLIRLNQFVNDA